MEKARVPKHFEDFFIKGVKTEEEMDEIIRELEAETTWESGVTSNKIKIKPIAGPMDLPDVIKLTGAAEEVAYDTAEDGGTRLMLLGNGRHHLVRSTALRSLYETAKISGSALGRLSPYRLSEVLNHCLAVARGSGLLLHRSGKVSAVLSDNYKIMPMEELLEVTRDRLHTDFGDPVFRSAEIDHDITVATWRLPDVKDQMMDAYQKAVDFSIRTIYSADFMPAVAFQSSDTGVCAATLVPHFISQSGGMFVLCDPIKVHHKRGAQEGVEYFRQKSDELFAAFLAMGETLERLSAIRINYPQNAFIGLCRKVNIPKKFAAEALEDFLMFTNNGTECCSGNDLYIAISECIAVAERAGCRGRTLSNLLECTSKILRLRLEDYDIPGVVAWGNNQ